jgi:hypothetical protein
MHRAGVAWHARSEVNAVASSMPRTVDSNGSRWIAIAIAARDFDDRSRSRTVIPATDDVPEQRFVIRLLPSLRVLACLRTY